MHAHEKYKNQPPGQLSSLYPEGIFSLGFGGDCKFAHSPQLSPPGEGALCTLLQHQGREQTMFEYF